MMLEPGKLYRVLTSFFTDDDFPIKKNQIILVLSISPIFSELQDTTHTIDFICDSRKHQDSFFCKSFSFYFEECPHQQEEKQEETD